MQEVALKSEQSKRYCQTMLDECPLNGSRMVIFKNTPKDSTAKQRRLQWLWYTEVSQSGLGQDDTKEDVHTRAKMQFAHPILMRDDDVYPILYDTFKNAVKTSVNYALYIKDFASQYISTERFTKAQRAEYLTGFQRFWIMQGANLTDPDTQGKNLLKYAGGNNVG